MSGAGLTDTEAAVLDAITASMDEPDGWSEVRKLIASLAEQGYIVTAEWRDPEVAEQRAKGWPDFHPETYCHRCGGKNVRSWFVDSDRFNAAVAALGLTYTAILCPGCFVQGHEMATGMHCTWTLTPATPFKPNEDDHDH